MQKSNKNFVVHVSRITGIGDGMIRTLDGYIGAVRILGVDIKHYKEVDKNVCMMAFGNVLQAITIPTKYVVLSCRPDYSQQIAYIARSESRQKNQARKKILQKIRNGLEHCQKNAVRRLTFCLLFDSDRSVIEKNRENMIDYFRQAKISASGASEEEICTVYRALLNGGAFDNDITSKNQ